LSHRWSGRVGLLATLIVLTGCHGTRVRDSRLYARLSQMTRRPGAHGGNTMDQLSKQGAFTVVTECGKTSFANVSEGLIVAETKLHEDVFTMRDTVSYRAVAYGLDDTLQLEEMLDAEARAAVHPEQQKDCIRSFAEHLESLTDPIVEGDRLQKQIDMSAFNRAAKQIEEGKQLEFQSLPVPMPPAAPASQK